MNSKMYPEEESMIIFGVLIHRGEVNKVSCKLRNMEIASLKTKEDIKNLRERYLRELEYLLTKKRTIFVKDGIAICDNVIRHLEEKLGLPLKKEIGEERITGGVEKLNREDGGGREREE